MKRRSYLHASAGQLTCAIPRRVVAAESVLKARQRRLLLDDAGIAEQRGLTRVFHQPEKRGAVMRAPKPEQTLQTRTAPIWDPQLGRYRLYVMGVPQNLWESADGLNWSPGPATNLRIDMAVLDPREKDPARRYKAALTNEGFAISHDGVSWTKTPVKPVPSSDEANFSYDPAEGLFIHSVKRSGPYGRSLAVAVSRDFERWDDYGVVFQADAEDQERGKRRIAERLANPLLQRPELNVPDQYSVQIYNMGVFHYEDRYLGMPSVFNQSGRVTKDWPDFDTLNLSPHILGEVRKYGDWTGFHEVQLLQSSDLKSWQRLNDRRPFLENSPAAGGAYDLQTIIGPSAPVVRGDELWFYYTGIKQYAYIKSGVVPGYSDYVPDKGAICLAVLRRDGFASLAAGKEGGTLRTTPFICPGKTLRVNADARAGGELRIEALDETGKQLAAAAPITGDQPWAEVRWPEGSFAALMGRRIALRFSLRGARLYSFGVK